MTERLQSDGLAVTRDEALELTIHHIRLAGMFFELVPEGATPEESLEICLQELHRQVSVEDLQRPAMERFLEAIVESYEEEKNR